jgi:hypothetical protein
LKTEDLRVVYLPAKLLFGRFGCKANEFSALQGAERSFASAKIEARK